MPPVKKPPKNDIAQITIRITAMMYKMFPIFYFVLFVINDLGMIEYPAKAH